MLDFIDTCRCGHQRSVHRHHRVGSDCGICGRARCPKFRISWPWLSRA